MDKKEFVWYVPRKRWQITEDYFYNYENSSSKYHCFRNGKSLCGRYEYQEHFRKINKKDISVANSCKSCHEIWKRNLKFIDQLNKEITIDDAI